VRSANGFAVPDLDFLEKGLKRYDIANLWAATGWFFGALPENVPRSRRNACKDGTPSPAVKAIPRARSAWWNTGQEVEPDPSKRGF